MSVSLIGFSTPWLPNSGIAMLDATPPEIPVTYDCFTSAYNSLSSAPIAVSTASTISQVTVLFNSNISLTSYGSTPSTWSITPPIGASSVYVTSVSVAGGTQVILGLTGEQTAGANYLINIQFGAVESNNVANAPATIGFVGRGLTPTVLSAVAQSPSSVLVTFSVPVNSSDATTITNYSINNGLVVMSVTMQTQSQYLINTSTMSAGTIYTITATNIRDLAGNPV